MVGSTKTIVVGAVLAWCTTVYATPMLLDFGTEDDFSSSLTNGQDIAFPDEFGNYVKIHGEGALTAGAAVFDTDPNGPNAGGLDPDMLVDKGNALILQSIVENTQTVPGIYDNPDNSLFGGTLVFEWTQPVQVLDLQMIDINNGQISQNASVTLVDGTGKQRLYQVPAQWTLPADVGLLDLTTLDAQPGHNSTATATEDAGFNPYDIMRMDVWFNSSGGMDDVHFDPAPLPEPTALVLLGLGGVALLRRRSA